MAQHAMLWRSTSVPLRGPGGPESAVCDVAPREMIEVTPAIKVYDWRHSDACIVRYCSMWQSCFSVDVLHQLQHSILCKVLEHLDGRKAQSTPTAKLFSRPHSDIRAIAMEEVPTQPPHDTNVDPSLSSSPSSSPRATPANYLPTPTSAIMSNVVPLNMPTASSAVATTSQHTEAGKPTTLVAGESQKSVQVQSQLATSTIDGKIQTSNNLTQVVADLGKAHDAHRGWLEAETLKISQWSVTVR
jgi:hypothetical protein